MTNKINHNLSDILLNALDENTTYEKIIFSLEKQEIENIILQIKNRIDTGFLFDNTLIEGYDKQFYKSLLNHTESILSKVLAYSNSVQKGEMN